MAEDAAPRLYLVTPDRLEPEALAESAAALIAAAPVACLRLDLGRAGEEEWVRTANLLLPLCHDAEIPLLIAEHYRLAVSLGLDGVHLADTRVPIRNVRKELGPERIIGAFAGTSSHQGMTAAEAGADYVSFGPVGDQGTLGEAVRAEPPLFQWWAEMIETPVVAEGGVTPDDVAALEATADFFVPDIAIWSDPDPAARLNAYAEALKG